MRNEFMGFLLVEAERTDIRIMRILGNHLSIALNSIILFERLDQSYRRLMEQAHKKGMADTGILHNIANIISSVNITRQALEDLMEDSCLDDLVMANDILANRFDELESFIRDDDGNTADEVLCRAWRFVHPLQGEFERPCREAP